MDADLAHPSPGGAATLMQDFPGRWATVGVDKTRPAWPDDSARALDHCSWRDETWMALVGRLDVVLRHWYGVYEFTADPRCVLRVGPGRARSTVELADGTRLVAGEPVGVLHLWNEHLPRFPGGKPDLHWAKTMRCRLLTSLQLLARHVACEPAWQEVQAVQAGISLAGALRGGQMRRVASSYGFEVLPADLSGFRRVHALGEDFLLWGFARAFNPSTLHRQPFFRARGDLWISRRTLLGRYGHADDGACHGPPSRESA